MQIINNIYVGYWIEEKMSTFYFNFNQFIVNRWRVKTYYLCNTKKLQVKIWLSLFDLLQLLSIMGTKNSKQEKIDSSGTVNNNVILTNTDIVNVYSQELVYLMAVLIGLKVFEIIMFMYLKHRRHWKKTYINRGNPA